MKQRKVPRHIQILVFILVIFSVAAVGMTRADEGVPAKDELVVMKTDSSGPDNEYAAEQYIYKSLGWTQEYKRPPMKSRGSDAGSRLNGKEAWLYEALKAAVENVAAGNSPSSVFSFPLRQVFDDIACSADELNVSDLNSEEARTAFLGKLYNSIHGALDALLYDCPYELYWYDKTTGCGISVSTDIRDDGKIHITDYSTGDVNLFYFVAADYSVTGEPGTCDVNPEKGQAVQSAVSRAMQIVASNAGLSDYKKLKAYKDAICSLTDYNFAALEGNGNYGDAWQLVYVFDDDPHTKVVCEGYSKAFQYLCDISTFTEARIISVTGTMAGGTGAGQHMWNNVIIDNNAYLADITNSDLGSAGEGGSLFLAGYMSVTSTNDRTWYCYADDYGGIVQYCYDNDTIAVFGENSADLTFSDNPYSETVLGQVEENGILYELNEYQATVVGYTEISSVLTIPDAIQGLPVTTIAEGAFHDCTALTEVYIPDSVRSLSGSYSSERYSGDNVMTETGVIHTAGGSQIIYFISGRGAFSGCVNLSAIHFGANSQLENIGPFSFAYTSISSLVVPENVINIDAGAFYWCPFLTTVQLNARLKTIGMCAFSIGHNRTEIEYGLPNTSSLRSVTFSGSIDYIGACAFSHTKLAAVSLPEGIKRIDEFAFYFSMLQGISIPSSVEYIGTGALITENITSINVSENNQHYSSADGILFSKDKKELICCPRMKTGICCVPESVVKIHEYAFFTTAISSCILPGSVRELGLLSFYGSQIQSINIPDGIITIPSGAFYGSFIQGNLVLPDSVITIQDSAFRGVHLESVTLGQNVKSIGEYAFYESWLTSVVMGSSVEFIGDYAFAESRVSNVTMPDDMYNWVDINNVFSNTPFLGIIGQCGDTVYYQISGSKLELFGHGLIWDFPGWNTPFNNHSEIKNVEIGEEITYIGDATFVNMTGITEITFPTNIVALGDSVFQACPNLRKITFLNPGCIIPAGTLDYGITVYGYDNSTAEEYANEHAGIGFVSLGVYQGGSLDLYGSGTFSAVQWVFSDNILTLTGEGPVSAEGWDVSASDYPWHEFKPFIRKTVIGEGVTSIGHYAFDGCSRMTEVSLPGSLKSIGEYAFNNCRRLQELVLPDSMEQIGDCAFRHCESITSIVLPESLSDVGDGICAFCYSLESFVLPTGTTRINEGMFSNCRGIRTLELPDGIVSIGRGAFTGCSSLTAVSLPESLCEIGEDAFDSTSITEIVIPTNVTRIERFTFAWCYQLKEIALPKNLTLIGEEAFYLCSSLTSVTIPAGVQFVDSRAFLGCTALKQVTVCGANTQFSAYAVGYTREGDVDYSLVPDCTILCKTGSAAAQYAENYGVHYVAVETAMTVSDISLATHNQDGMIKCTVVLENDLGISEQEIISHNAVLSLPDGLKTIEDEAFCHTKAQQIVVSSTCTSIGSRAMADCADLKVVVIPDSVTSIAEDAFAGSKVIILCSAGSYASQYAHDHHMYVFIR